MAATLLVILTFTATVHDIIGLAVTNKDVVNVIANSRKTCHEDDCKPEWTPYPNMEYALQGYNLRKGDPLAEVDPGFMHQIFEATVKNSDGRYILADGITAEDLDDCTQEMSSHSFTNIKSFRDFVTNNVKTGENLQIGVQQKVTAGVKMEGVGISDEETIPPPFTRGWSDSTSTQNLEKLFTEKKGMVAIVTGHCLNYAIKLNAYEYPPLKEPLKKAIAELYAASVESEKENESLGSSLSLAWRLHHSQQTNQFALPFNQISSQESAKKAKQLKQNFKMFIGQYGTHFLIESYLGVEFFQINKYSGKIRKSFNDDKLASCNSVEGSKVFGIQVEEDKSSCTSSDQTSLSAMEGNDYIGQVVTKGATPKDIRSWSKENFSPFPIRFKLSPIVNLFTDEILKANNIESENGKKVTDSYKIRKWFLPLYWDYCKTMELDCSPKKGCGIDDKCPLGTFCINMDRKIQYFAQIPKEKKVEYFLGMPDYKKVYSFPLLPEESKLKVFQDDLNHKTKIQILKNLYDGKKLNEFAQLPDYAKKLQYFTNLSYKDKFYFMTNILYGMRRRQRDYFYGVEEIKNRLLHFEDSDDGRKMSYFNTLPDGNKMIYFTHLNEQAKLGFFNNLDEGEKIRFLANIISEEIKVLEHQCTEWSEWSCNSKCSSKHQSRTRTCNGCSDNKNRENRKNEEVCRPKSCFPDKEFTVPGHWGDWGDYEYCPTGHFIISFNSKVQDARGYAFGPFHTGGDDTALNKIEMRCNDDGKTIITSKFADDGSFDTESKPCPGGFTAFKLKVEEEQGKAYVDDDTAANAIELRCADDEKWHKSKEGGWGGWSGVKECPKGYRLAGIKTRVEKNQGGGAGDDTALNGVTMVCKWFDKND